MERNDRYKKDLILNQFENEFKDKILMKFKLNKASYVA